MSDNFIGGQQQRPQHLEEISSFNVIKYVTKQSDTHLQYLGHKKLKIGLFKVNHIIIFCGDMPEHE